MLNVSSNFWTTPRAGFFLSRQQRYEGYREIFSSTLMTINSSLLCLSPELDFSPNSVGTSGIGTPLATPSPSRRSWESPPSQPSIQPSPPSKLCRMSPQKGTPAPERRGISACLPCREPEGRKPPYRDSTRNPPFLRHSRHCVTQDSAHATRTKD